MKKTKKKSREQQMTALIQAFIFRVQSEVCELIAQIDRIGKPDDDDDDDVTSKK